MAKEKKPSGWKDPVRRPRYIIWSGVVVLALAAFIVVAFGGSSTYWFCSTLCHSVQGDAIAAYNQGSHNTVSCLSCHEPVNGDPLIFTYRKAEAGILGGYQLATKTYSSPLNPTSELALNRSKMDFSDDHCTQCHNLDNRKVTPSEGIIINHDAHTDREVNCTACHNRVAHPETGLETIAKNPETGEPAAKHANFMSMTACFRCHTLTDKSPSGAEFKAPGTCATCHPADFNLKPSSHYDAGFFPKGHADLAIMDVDQATGRPAKDVIRPVVHGEEASEETSGSKEATASEEAKAAGEENPEVLPVVEVQQVDYCQTCHVEATFCTPCHGMEMPHPEEFKTKTHPQIVPTAIDKCEMCHQQSTTYFCDNCHHGSKVGWTFDPATPWQNQHAKTVVEKGVAGCLGACHDQQFCVDCHNKLRPLPTSHKAADWLHSGLTVTTYPDGHPAATAAHAVSAQKSVDSCDVCHGPGGVSAAFCQNCHGIEMPHPDAFKKNHVSGRNTPGVCANCHQQAELCSDCHHKGAVNGTPWQKQHPATVAADGAAGCFETCHQDKQFCVDCHTKLKAVPASHKVGDWTHRTTDAGAAHQLAYKKQADACDFCHGDGGVKAAFCQNCHQLEMPHPSGFKDKHKEGFAAGTYTKPVCLNCHAQYFCDACHHEGAVPEQPWRTYHPNIVKAKGADGCFKCHKPTFCSYCHVRL